MIRSYKYKKSNVHHERRTALFSANWAVLTFIARTTILHRQPFFYPHDLNKKKREVVSNFFRTFAIWKLRPPYRFTEYGSADGIATTILPFAV